MHFTHVLWMAAGVAGVLLLLVALTRLTANARLRRRLKKTRGRIVSKAHEPSVKFSVKPPKE